MAHMSIGIEPTLVRMLTVRSIRKLARTSNNSSRPFFVCLSRARARFPITLITLQMANGDSNHSENDRSSQSAGQRTTQAITAARLDQRTLDTIISGVTAQLREERTNHR